MSYLAELMVAQHRAAQPQAQVESDLVLPACGHPALHQGSRVVLANCPGAGRPLY